MKRLALVLILLAALLGLWSTTASAEVCRYFGSIYCCFYPGVGWLCQPS